MLVGHVAGEAEVLSQYLIMATIGNTVGQSTLVLFALLQCLCYMFFVNPLNINTTSWWMLILQV